VANAAGVLLFAAFQGKQPIVDTPGGVIGDRAKEVREASGGNFARTQASQA
jgi:hypothetical protein